MRKSLRFTCKFSWKSLLHLIDTNWSDQFMVLFFFHAIARFFLLDISESQELSAIECKLFELITNFYTILRDTHSNQLMFCSLKFIRTFFWLWKFRKIIETFFSVQNRIKHSKIEQQEKKTKCGKYEQETKIKSTEIKKEMHKLEKKIGLFSFSRISVVSIKLVKTFTH